MPELPTQQTSQRAPQKSRREVLKEDGVEPEMPPLEWGQYLIDYLFEFGPTMAAGMGAGPLIPPVIESIERVLGIQFHPWQSRLLLRLSREYLEESHRATAQNCEPPWRDPASADVDRMAMAKRMERAMLSLVED